eukprot:4322571-Alexandrium_andersonii.AAC.1
MSARPSDDLAVATRVLEDTVAQVAPERGWLQGPLSAEALDGLHPEGWLGARRFGVPQGTKVRLVDDFSELG